MRNNLSDLDLELLKYFEGNAKTIREAADEFGEPRGYARTTVATLMERLRQKGYLKREKADGLYRYTSAMPAGQLMRSVVGRFVDRTLGGSVTPLVAYLAEADSISDEDLAELRRFLEDAGGDK
jgi:predicted transcriptional regulator